MSHQVRSDTYGICQECDMQIGKLRLKANPDANLCLVCAEEEEFAIRHRRVTPIFARSLSTACATSGLINETA